MGFKIFSVNEYLTEADVNSFLSQQVVAVKSANESVTSSTTLQDDNHLLVTVQPNTNYWLDMMLITDGAVGGDIKLSIVVPSGTARWMTSGLDVAATATLANVNRRSLTGGTSTGADVGTIASGTWTIIPPAGIIRIGASGGTVKLQWAQNTSSATATRILSGSIMRLLRVKT